MLNQGFSGICVMGLNEPLDSCFALLTVRTSSDMSSHWTKIQTQSNQSRQVVYSGWSVLSGLLMHTISYVRCLREMEVQVNT